MILLLAVMFAALAPAAGRCCSLGGGASYDYLGDSAMSIEMESSDEFLRDNVAQSTLIVEPDWNQKEKETRRLRLNLSDNGSIELLVSAAEGSIAGRGDLTRNNEILALGAEGMLQQSMLRLNATAPGGEVYRFDLVMSGSIVLGNFSRTMPDGRKASGTAEGWWKV